MNYGNIKECDIADGPGVRVSLFVSGCRHHCKGCFNEETWNFNYGQPYTEETEAENAQVKQSPEEMRQKELKEVIEQYNREKQDPDYYYLPDSWDGQTLKWQKPGESTGTLLAALALFAAVVLMLKKAREQPRKRWQNGQNSF